MNSNNKKKLYGAIRTICKLNLDDEKFFEILSDSHCNLIEKLGFDSLLIVELILEIESQFDFEFDMNSLNINKLKYLDNLEASIDNYINE